MDLIDSHCHLDVEEFDADRETVYQRAAAAGVRDIIVPGIHAAGWPRLLDLCRRHTGLHPALGLHPVYLAQHRPEHLDELERLLRTERPVAIGEIGLDFALKELDPEQQQHYFRAQLELAVRHRLPVILHVRKSHEQVLQLLAELRPAGGICHAFNGSLEQGLRYHRLGFRLGFGGMLTFERSSKLRRLAGALPLESLVLETDAPDLTVASHRFERNSPEYLPEIAATLAQLRGLSLQQIADQTSHNLRSLFAL